MGNTETADHFLNEFKGLVDKFPDNVECKTMYSQVSSGRFTEIRNISITYTHTQVHN